MEPQSMPVGERNVLRSNDSASLWNCTLSPGWVQEESNILRLALMKYGVGNWSKILESQCLPGKTNAQLNLQTQRMLGQQSTAEFAGLHIDPMEIGSINSKRQGPEIKRKNNFIVNTGGKMTKEERVKRLKDNQAKFGLSKETIHKIFVPKFNKNDKNKRDVDKMQLELVELKEKLVKVRKQIQNFDE